MYKDINEEIVANGLWSNPGKDDGQDMTHRLLGGSFEFPHQILKKIFNTDVKD